MQIGLFTFISTNNVQYRNIIKPKIQKMITQPECPMYALQPELRNFAFSLKSPENGDLII